MGWRGLPCRLTGGALVAMWLLSVTVSVLSVGLSVGADRTRYLLGSPAPETTLGAVLVGAAVVVALVPVFAAGVGVYGERYGTLAAVFGTLYGAVGLVGTYGMLPYGVREAVPQWALVRWGVVLTWLLLWPLSVAVGYVESDGRRVEDAGPLGRARNALQGPLFPFAVVAGILIGVWTTPEYLDDGAAIVVFGGMPFLAVLAGRALDGEGEGEGEKCPLAGDLSPAERALWTLGTRPLLAISVGVVGLFALASAASWLGLVSGPVLETGVGVTAPVTPTRIIGAGALPPFLGTVYVLGRVDGLLEDWGEAVAECRGDHADGLENPTGVTVVDVRDRVVGVGPPRTARVEHLLLGDGTVRVVVDRELDLVTLEVKPLSGTTEFDAHTPLAARESDRVHVDTADGKRTFTPHGDPDRVVEAVDGRYDSERGTPRRPRGRDRPTSADD